jgi:hypothetical protein
MRLGRADIPSSVEELLEFRHRAVIDQRLADLPALSAGLYQVTANPLQAAVLELQIVYILVTTRIFSDCNLPLLRNTEYA